MRRKISYADQSSGAVPKDLAMEQPFELSPEARKVVEGVFEDYDDAKEMADALCDVETLRKHRWEQEDVDEAFVWLEIVTQILYEVSAYKLWVNGTEMKLSEAYKQCELPNYKALLTEAAFFGDDLEESVRQIIEIIKADYASRGISVKTGKAA